MASLGEKRGLMVCPGPPLPCCLHWEHWQVGSSGTGAVQPLDIITWTISEREPGLRPLSEFLFCVCKTFIEHLLIPSHCEVL